MSNRRRWWCLLNPPTNFIDHERAVRQRAEVFGVTVKEIRYGFGPSSELELELPDGPNRAAVEFFESLRTELKMTALDPVCELTAEDRQELAPDVPPSVSFPPPGEESSTSA